jgi:SAM-dependent methyltransferase
MARNVFDRLRSTPGFDFGSNWLAFSENRLNAARLRIAQHSLQELVERASFRGASFLDVGCGTGLFSLAAHQLGAGRVVGIDISPNSIEASLKNRNRFAPASAIYFREASVLNPDVLEELGSFEIVYAWGVLHHTGSMWQAIRNVAQLVLPDGILILSIYNKHLTSPLWKAIKWLYNKLPPIVQRLMTIIFAGVIYLAKLIVTRGNPLEKERGMDFWYDIIDWIGGYPYEYAQPGEVISYMDNLGFRLFNYISARVPTGCNEFVFRRVDT